jgi:hypothetical protein
MTDAEFIDQLESCRLPEFEFGHSAHVRAGYVYLRRHKFPQALERMCTAIAAYSAALGKADRYHETITVSYMALINERMCTRGDGGNWRGFEEQNPELFRKDLLLDYYPSDLLASDEARARMMLVPMALWPRSRPET